MRSATMRSHIFMNGPRPGVHSSWQQDRVVPNEARLQRPVGLELPFVVQAFFPVGWVQQDQTVIREHEHQFLADRGQAVGGRRQAAGWFLDQVGAKQMSIGGAGVFEKHANIIVKKNASCTTRDVYELSRKMADAVKKFHGLDLVREVRLVGKFDGVAFDPQQVIW